MQCCPQSCEFNLKLKIPGAFTCHSGREEESGPWLPSQNGRRRSWPSPRVKLSTEAEKVKRCCCSGMPRFVLTTALIVLSSEEGPSTSICSKAAKQSLHIYVHNEPSSAARRRCSCVYLGRVVIVGSPENTVAPISHLWLPFI